MDERPLFSVIIPAYQRPKLLAAAIESVVVQSWSDWELLVVDDGSRKPLDLSRWLSTDQRIKLLRQDNQGPAAARKSGAKQSTGRYLCFLDDDDYFLPDHLATLADYLEAHDFPESVVRTPLAGRYTDDRIVTYPNFNNTDDGLFQYWQSPCGITSLAFPRSVITHSPIDPAPRIIEDFEWVSRVLIKYPLLQIPGKPTVIYRQHETNRTLVEGGIERTKERIKIIHNAYAEPGVDQRVPPRTYQNLLAHQWFHAARQAALAGERSQAIQLLSKAITTGGWRQVRQFFSTLYHLL
ncbi:hypothetical protein CEQ90_04450 [Lewinellaceae bacterium SD302]|nr:hypothetical protein CEQ90_04450 [Lewinellaceae bacterium SD302]